MLIAKVFLPLAAPGFFIVGSGLVAVTHGAYNTVEVIAIVLGLLVVAVAGVFTIRSNVAKIWREQAEGEKARVTDLTTQISELRIETAANLAELIKENAAQVAALQIEATEQRELKHKAETELAAANMRTDLTPCLRLLDEILGLLRAGGKVEVTGAGGGPVQVEATENA